MSFHLVWFISSLTRLYGAGSHRFAVFRAPRRPLDCLYTSSNREIVMVLFVRRRDLSHGRHDFLRHSVRPSISPRFLRRDLAAHKSCLRPFLLPSRPIPIVVFNVVACSKEIDSSSLYDVLSCEVNIGTVVFVSRADLRFYLS